jgi:ketosteroid isomerase-like protein
MTEAHDEVPRLLEAVALATRRPERDTGWAMSKENVEIVRRFYDVQDDPDQVLALCDPDIVITNTAISPETAPYTGHDGVAKWAKAAREAVGDFRVEADEIIDVDENRVVVVGRVCGRGRSSGLTVEVRLSTVFTLRDRKILDVRAYETKSQALEAVGLRE